MTRLTPPSLAAGLLIALASNLSATTIAYWNFDEGAPSRLFSDKPVVDSSGAGHVMRGFDAKLSPAYSAIGDTPSGAGLCLDTMEGGRDGFVETPALQDWRPEQWTIEATVWLDNATGFITVIGRDGSFSGNAKADFYLQRNDEANQGKGAWRVDFATAGGQRIIIDTDYAPKAQTWYQLAVTSDGTNVRFYVNDLGGEAGYQEVGTEALTGVYPAANALIGSGSAWTFGRGWWSGTLINHLDGKIDEIRFSDKALKVSQLISIRKPAAPPSTP